jgi:hypothetical protein
MTGSIRFDPRQAAASKRVMRWPFIGFGAILVLIPLLQFWYVNHWVLLGVLLAGALISAAFLTSAARRDVAAHLAIGGAAVGVLAQLLWFVTAWYPLAVIAQGAAMIAAFTCFAQAWSLRRRERVTGARRAVRWGVRGALPASSPLWQPGCPSA